MVKPPRGMQPENVDLKKAGRAAGKSFTDDSFRSYMARKIDLQRRQFGFVQPPPPPSDTTISESISPSRNIEREQPKKHAVRFAHDVKDEPSSTKKRKKRSGLQVVLKRLKRRHGRLKRKRGDSSLEFCQIGDGASPSSEKSVSGSESQSETVINSPRRICRAHRPDLFFSGVVVLINGYTNPDTDTLQRLLHKHGGDLERYETSRVTHIIAEHLSKAKATIYKNRRKPIPVCYPTWIVDSAKAMTLLPHGKYLIEEVRDEGPSMPSVASFFHRPLADARVADLTTASTTHETVGVAPICDPTPDHVQLPTRLDSEMQQVRSNDSFGSVPNVASVENDTSPAKVGERSIEEKSDCPDVQSQNNDSRLDIGTSACSNIVEDVHATSDRVKTDRQYINGRVRTVGTDPHFLETFFAASRLSFIGSYKQRAKASPTKKFHGSSQQQRYIFHIDMDCFFAAVALRNYPEYQDKPVAISHCGKQTASTGPRSTKTKYSTSECATCNYVARSFGIKKGMCLGRAKELCPDLVVLQYDFIGYEEVSEQVVDIISHYAHKYGGNVEQVSCDEAYLELFLNEGKDGETRLHVSSIAEGIRTEIFESTQCTATVGVAPNKFLAKLASDRVKPNRAFVVIDYRELLLPLKLRDLHGIGYRLDRKLEEEGLFSVKDVWDLGEQAESELMRILGAANGKKIFQFCHGIDDRSVEVGPRKTIGAECNYGVRFNGSYGVEHMIKELAKEVEKRMEHVGVVGVKATLKLKQRKPGAPPPPKFLGHGRCYNLSRSCDVPGSKATRDWHLISQCCIGMFVKMDIQKEDIRGMGIVMSKLQTNEVDAQRDRRGKSVLEFFNDVVDDQETPRDNCCSRTGTIQRQTACSSFDEPGSSSTGVSAKEETAGQRATDNVVSPNDYLDIEVPSASQIHMSQVHQLPSPMRRQVLSKIDRGTTAAGDIPEDLEAKAAEETRFRQVDVRRMMKLAAVKSGEQGLPEMVGGEHVSLTQLESLPLEMQLQVANNDHRPVGVLSPKSRSIVPKRKKQKSTNDLQNRAVEESQIRFAQASNAGAVGLDPSHTESPDSFFVDNVRPLAVFLDENMASNEEAVAHVVQFLEICMEEGRFSDAIVLLRSIKNRQDQWSGTGFDSIFDAINMKAKKLLGDGLDREWIASN